MMFSDMIYLCYIQKIARNKIIKNTEMYQQLDKQKDH